MQLKIGAKIQKTEGEKAPPYDANYRILIPILQKMLLNMK